ncbi:MAG: hypothetical protein P8Z36_00340 [Gemmatimonadota bacterium]
MYATTNRGRGSRSNRRATVSGAFTVLVATVLAACAMAAPRPVAAQGRPTMRQARAQTPPRQDMPKPDPANILVDPSLFGGLQFRNVGPSRGGRVTTVTGDPVHKGTFYMGATGGGVWKTEDYGITWHNVSDGYFASPSMGSLALAPSDPSIIYAGTGSDGIRSNVILGRGIYRSDDAGRTWRFLGLRDAGQIGAVVVDPKDPDLVYVAALGTPFGRSKDRGVYRSKDGGKTWQNVLFVSDSVGAVDLELKPDDPHTIYASLWHVQRKPWTIISGGWQIGGIYKSTDGGDHWQRKTKGLPTGLIGKSDLAVSAADPDRVYALVETTDPDEGLYRSDDAGETWRLVSNQAGLMNRPFYYTNVAADPTNADVVYVNDEGAYKSTDGGKTWNRMRTPHGDNHDMWIDPDNPKVFIQSNDGGANITQDGGETWSTQLNQPTAELYQVHLDDRFPYWMFSGQQDESTVGVPSRPTTSSPPADNAARWEEVGGCETGPAVPRLGTTLVYSNCKGRFGVYDHSTGQERQYYIGAQNIYGHAASDLKYRFQRVSPIAIAPQDPGTVYFGSQYVHRSTDNGITWTQISPDLTAHPAGTQGISGGPITRDITGEEFYSTLYAIEVSPHDPNVIWVGSNDGLFHVTRDGGQHWTDITPPTMPPGGRVQNIEPSPHTPGKAYYAYNRWVVGNDWAPYVYMTDDYGATWRRLTDGTNGIPADDPVRIVREDPVRPGLLYAGTQFGLFISFDDGAHWQPFQLNLPITPVTDIRIHQGDLVLSTMGRSFWILNDVSRLEQLRTGSNSSSNSNSTQGADAIRLYAPRAAYRMRYRSFSYGAPSAAAPDYAPVGATIDYRVFTKPAGEVVIEIVDGQGNVVRGYSSNDDGWQYTFPAMARPRTARIGGPRVDTRPGAHRILWDLTYPGPWTQSQRQRGQRGPMVPPGTYTVRLQVGGRMVAQQPLEVKADPRVIASGVSVGDMTEQLRLNLQIRDLMSAAQGIAARLDSALDRLGKAGTAQAERQQLEGIRARLVTNASGKISSYPQPMLIDQIAYLYGMTTRADQKPGRDAYERYQELSKQLDALRNRLGGVLQGAG